MLGTTAMKDRHDALAAAAAMIEKDLHLRKNLFYTKNAEGKS